MPDRQARRKVIHSNCGDVQQEQVTSLIFRLQRLTHDCLKDLVSDAPLGILDFPDIRNCGDSAIWLGEMAYLRNFHAGKRPDYISRMHDFSAGALRKAVPEGPIFIHGGGNFGDIWPSHQDFREHILDIFRDRRIVQFPQSIHFSDQARIDQAARAIGKHRNFVLLVRDEASREFATKYFDCEVRLCPDMAFCIGALERIQPVSTDVLAMLRDDDEATGLDRAASIGVPTEDWITESRRSVRLSKMRGFISAYLALHPSERRLRMLDAAAHNRFRRGVRQLSRARAVVTDRLHVHIVSLLLGIPHAVLDNNYGKIRRFMAAFGGGTGLSYQADSLVDAVSWARDRATRRS